MNVWSNSRRAKAVSITAARRAYRKYLAGQTAAAAMRRLRRASMRAEIKFYAANAHANPYGSNAQIYAVRRAALCAAAYGRAKNRLGWRSLAENSIRRGARYAFRAAVKIWREREERE